MRKKDAFINYRSPFERWRKQLRLTQQEAADLFEMKKRQIQNYDAGSSRPSKAMRIVMTMVSQGHPLPTPWPEEYVHENVN